jgi:trimeric autotransporter adhesin
MRKLSLLPIVLFFSNLLLAQQGIGIGNSTPHASSLLDITSTNKGVLIPRMNKTQRNAIPTPAQGLMVFQNGPDTVGLYCYNGASWQMMTTNSWSTNGNANTNNSNFIGTTDPKNLTFRTNNVQAAKLDYQLGNYYYGYEAGLSATLASGNIAIGSFTQKNLTEGYDNIALGNNALQLNTTGSDNIAIGASALYSANNSSRNLGIGNLSLFTNQASENNVAVGHGNLNVHTLGNENTAVGADVLGLDISGYENTAVGSSAMGNNSVGFQNTAIGVYSLLFNKSGHSNTALGHNALAADTGSNSNVALGLSAGDNFMNGNENVFVGAFANAANANFSNTVAIGYGAEVTASNQVRLGNFFTASIGGKVAWSTVSDARFKTNLQNNVPGLAFINQLKPLTYQLDNEALYLFTNKNLMKQLTADTSAEAKAKLYHILQGANVITKDNTVYSGFLAQDVATTALHMGYQFSGVDAPKNEDDAYALRYSEFVVPLVKSVQELSKQNEELKEQISLLSKRLEALEQKK